MALSSEEMTLLASRALHYLEDVQAANCRMSEDLAKTQSLYQQTLVDLAGAEMREMAIQEELHRALEENAALQKIITRLARPWWRRWTS